MPDPGLEQTVMLTLEQLHARQRAFGPYELRGELGRGGMGVVYRAYHTSLRRDCALKMLDGQRSDAVTERLVLEGQASAKLGKHPNIVQVFDAGVIDGRAYIAMEYVAGQPLDQRIAERGRVSEPELLEIGRKLAMALGHAHQCGIVHRDMKPGNVIIDTQGEPQVLDFGLAKDLEVVDSALSVAGSIIGTPNYMPPEQADSERGETGPRSDVYSLGATLYHAISGRMPFRAERVVDVIVQVLSRPAPRLRPRGVEISPDLEAVILKAMEKEKRHRYNTALELADDLARIQQGDAPRARPVGVVGRLWRKARRNPALFGLVALLLMFVAASLAYVVYRQGEADALWANAYRQVARAATAETRDLLEPALPLLEEMNTLASFGLLPVDDPDGLGKHIAARFVHRERLSWLSYGDAEGRFIGATRRGEGVVILNHSWIDGDGVGHLREEQLLAGGDRRLLREDDAWSYDPRTTDWYARAAAAEAPVWLEPYPWHDDEGLGITLTRPWREGGAMRGAFTADFHLDALSRFLAGLPLGDGGRAYLLQRDGVVVARSDAGAGPHEALDAALARVDPAALADGEPVTVEVEADGERHVAAFEAFEVAGGLRWITAVVTPTRTVRGDVHATAQVLLALGGGLLGAILIGALAVLLRRHRRVRRRKETLRLP